MSLRARLSARGLPSTTVPVIGGQVTVRALSPEHLRKLTAQHPPTGEQAEQGMPWNSDTLTPALLSACVDLGPGESWSEQDWAAQFQAAGSAVEEIVRLVDIVYGINGPKG